MKKLSFFVALVFGLFLTSQLAAQQKYGHINLGNLMEQMPEIVNANATLVALNDSLTVVDSTMAAEFQADYEAYMRDAQAGGLTRIQMEQKEIALKKQQQTVLAFEEAANQKVEDKKAALLSPMLERIDAAVKAVAKEKGYAMIFDTSTGFMLYVAESEDIMPMVKTKLGITK